MDNRNKSHMKEVLFEAVQKQIVSGKPAETKKTYDRLLQEGHTREQALRLIASVLLAEMNRVMQTRTSFNEDRYIKSLKALPRLPGNHLP